MSTWRWAAGDASGATARARQATAKRAAARTVAAHGGQRSGAGLSGGRSTTAAWCRDVRSPPGGAWPPRRGPDPHAAPAARARWRGCAPPRSAGRFPRVRRSAWPRRPWRRCPARAGPAPGRGPPGAHRPRAAAAGWRRDRARAHSAGARRWSRRRPGPRGRPSRPPPRPSRRPDSRTLLPRAVRPARRARRRRRRRPPRSCSSSARSRRRPSSDRYRLPIPVWRAREAPASTARSSSSPDLRGRLLGRLPHCARGRVLEQDAPRAEILADRVRSAEVLAPARLVALGDRGRDLRLAHPGAGGASRPQRGQEAPRLLAEDAEHGGDTRQVGTQGRGRRRVAGVEGAVQLAHAVVDRAERPGGVQIVVHGGDEVGEKRRERAGERAGRRDGRRGPARRLVGTRERLIELFELAGRLLQAAGPEVERRAVVRAEEEEAERLARKAIGRLRDAEDVAE